MQKIFQLRSSTTELTVIFGLLLLAAVFALIYLNPGVVQSLYLIAIVVLGAGEWLNARRRQRRYLVVAEDRFGLVGDQGEQPYFSNKNKVYRCRWFAILKLYDRHSYRTEILFPDRFNSLQAYRECRFLLRRQPNS